MHTKDVSVCTDSRQIYVCLCSADRRQIYVCVCAQTDLCVHTIDLSVCAESRQIYVCLCRQTDLFVHTTDLFAYADSRRIYVLKSIACAEPAAHSQVQCDKCFGARAGVR